MKEVSRNLNLKSFIIYSITTYPLVLFSLLYNDAAVQIIGNKEVFYVLLWLVFAVLTWILAQKNISIMVAVAATFVGLYTIVQNIPATGTPANSILVYFLFFPVVTLYQVSVWIPFLTKFIWQNRGHLDNLSFD